MSGAKIRVLHERPVDNRYRGAPDGTGGGPARRANRLEPGAVWRRFCSRSWSGNPAGQARIQKLLPKGA